MVEATRKPLLGQSSNRIEQFHFGEIVVDHERYTGDVIVFEDHVTPAWWRKTGHVVELDDLTEALAWEPETLIIGTGTQQSLRIAPEVVAYTMRVGIELLAFDTRTACQTFNLLRGKRRVVAALHLSC